MGIVFDLGCDGGVSPAENLASVTPSFVRATTAVKMITGETVLSGVPRFEGIGSVVQAGTVNVLTANQAGFTTGTAGWAKNQGTETVFERVTGSQYFTLGSGALHIECPGNATGEGTFTSTNANTIPNSTYTYSVYLCGTGTIRISISERNAAGGAIGDTALESIILTSTPTMYSVSRAFGVNGHQVMCKITTSGQSIATIYASGIQVELGASATQWVAGQTRRATTYEKSGLTVEEGTTNLLSANQAGLTTDLTSFNPLNGSTLTRVTDAQFRMVGTASVKVVTANLVASEGFNIDAAIVSANQTYTVSLWLCGSGTIRLALTEKTAVGDYVGQTDSNIITLTATPTRYSVTRTMGATGERAYPDIYTPTQQGITFYASGIQLEQKAYATSWKNPADGARNSELVTFPSAGFLSPSQGTIEIIVNVKPYTKGAVIFATSNVWPNNQLKLSREAGPIWQFLTANSSGTLSGVSVVDDLSLGLHRFAFTWDASYIRLYIDGVQRGTPVASPNLPSLVGANPNIGESNYDINSQISDFVVSNVARSPTELANRGVLTPLGIDQYTTLYLPFTASVNEAAWRPPVKALDLSGRGNHGVVTGAKVVAAPKGTCWSFDGIDDVITIPNPLQNIGTNDFSLGGWIWYDEYRKVAGFNGGGLFGTPTLVPGVQLGTDGEPLRFYIRTAGGMTILDYNSPLPTKKWLHLYAVRKGLYQAIYLNGVMLVSQTNASIVDLVGLDATMTIGKSYSGNPLIGRISGAQIYDYALSPSEVATLYESTRDQYVEATPLQLPQASNLVLDLELDNLFDKSPEKNHGHAGGGSTIVFGDNRMYIARDFDGVDDSINCGKDASLNDLTQMTLSAWIYARTAGQSNQGRIFYKLNGSAGWMFYLAETTGLLKFSRGGSTGAGVWYTNSTVGLGAWHHVLLVYDKSSPDNDPIFYKDGVAVAKTEYAAYIGTLPTDAAVNLCIGGGAFTFDGKILAPHVWKVILTPAEVLTLYKQEKALYGL